LKIKGIKLSKKTTKRPLKKKQLCVSAFSINLLYGVLAKNHFWSFKFKDRTIWCKTSVILHLVVEFEIGERDL